MRFSNSIYLLLLLLIPLVAMFFVYAAKLRKKNLQKLGNLKLLEKLSDSLNYKVRKVKTLLLVVSLFFIIITIAGPQFGKRMKEVKRSGRDIIVAIDCSKSMLAEDIKPNRLLKSKNELSTLIDRLQGDRIGIIAFAGTAFVQCPLTLDYGSAKMFLNLIDSNLIPYPGTAIGKAIELSIKSFSQKERKYKVLILLTDGEDHKSNPLDTADEAKKEGIIIYTIGIGTPEGDVIPVKDENNNVVGYTKDKNQQTVMSKLDETTLQKIALVTGGKYYRSTSGELEVDRIYEEISLMEKKELKSMSFSQYEHRFQYFLIIVFLLLAVEFILSERKRYENN
ncbi:MAG: hypothetical protein A2474_05780 [Elusimicrobia bacterium RIFOXYC2_FULL_34_12]|nr:MAG: hypothetical protein A2474_05780 [Elusimicrobia bacterium RIFOXYC2_FULL_34_12]OGS38769.1 MAG: hypothetical protein A2551_01040 [Elusimicrobia bacterium RIFOXYD2_FULL_34_30]